MRGTFSARPSDARSPSARLRSIGLSAALALAGCTGDICDASNLRAALDGAREGDVVHVGPCRVEGVSVVVPEGVTLEGTTGSVLAGEDTVVTLERGAVLRSLAIEVNGGTGVRAAAAELRVADVELDVLSGVGVVLRGASGTFERVQLRGHVDPATLAPGAEPADGSYGLAILDGSAIELVDVGIEEMGPWGAIIDTSELTWRRGLLRSIVGTSVYVAGGRAVLEDLRIEDPVQGIQLLPPYGVVATAGAEVEASGVSVVRSEGLGVLVDGASGTFTGLTVDEARYGGVWVQGSEAVTFEDAALARNGLAGITAVESSVAILGGTVRETARELSVLGEVTGVFAGDGLAIVRPSGDTMVADLALAGHERVGALFDVTGGSVAGLTLSNVMVDGSALGCLAQDGAGLIALGGWDAGVTRAGATAANDLAQTAPLTALERIATRNLPQIDPGMLDP